MGSDPRSVDINGKHYNITRRVHSHSRGHEYELGDPERGGQVFRVCWAPAPGEVPGGTFTVYTSGEQLTFHP